MTVSAFSISDVKDLAITSLLIAMHMTVGGETMLSIMELAIDIAARFALEQGYIKSGSDVNSILSSIAEALTRSTIKVADEIQHEAKSREVVISVKGCIFRAMCHCVEMRWSQYESIFGKRPCPVASFYRHVLERTLNKKYDIADVKCSQGTAALTIREL